ncbi:MAG TPA: response regulator [Spirochaetota bacterium]|nr:response regulator [Spirochaetota bacterium]
MITEKKILIAEDDESSAELLRAVCEEHGYTTDIASNGKDAYKMYRQDNYPLVITDLEMPDMSGHDLIKNIKKINDRQVIIVSTMHADSETIISVMREGVYDYIIKPINLTIIIQQIKRAFEADELYRSRELIEQERIIKLENQLEWVQWNKEIINRDNDRIDTALFDSLNNSFNQGAGFGALLSLINLVASSIKKEGDHYVVPSDIFDLIKSNAAIAEKTLNFFSDLSLLMKNDISISNSTCMDIYDLLLEIVNSDNIKNLSNLRGHTILLSNIPADIKDTVCKINPRYISTAINELFVNALKFSTSNSKITVMLRYSGGKFLISVLNTPQPTKSDIIGIPPEYQNVVFEPFFRLVKVVYEDYGTLDYGLGLTLVDKIVRSHGGRVDIGNVIDHTDPSRDPVTKVLAQIVL